MSIQNRLIGLVTVLLVLMAVGLGLGIFQLFHIGSELQRVTQRDLPLREVVDRINSLRLEQLVNFERALRLADQNANQPDDAIPIKEARAEFSALGERVRDALQRGRMLIGPSADSPDVEVSAALEEIMQSFSRYESHGQTIFDMLIDGRSKDAKIELFTLAGEETDLQDAARRFSQAIADKIQASTSVAQAEQKRAVTAVAALSLVAVVSGLVLAIFVTRSITKPLGAASSIAEEIASGNKDLVVPEHYSAEVGRLLGVMKQMLAAINESEKQLQARAEELARSNAELEQFAYVASHDLQEPLRMIGSFVQLLGERYQGRLDPNADEIIGFAVDGVQRMRSLIHDLLEYSRVGRKGKPFEVIDCKQVLERTKLNLLPALEESQAQLKIGELPKVSGDEVQLIRLFQNLIGNALKFRVDGRPPIVEVSAEQTDGQWLFRVKDNGIGIDPSYQDVVFQIFQRLQTSREYPGTGIGLAICKKIVERHGGRIWVESELGQGACFCFLMPAVA